MAFILHFTGCFVTEWVLMALCFVPIFVSIPDRSWPLGLGLASGMALVLGSIKYRTGTYIPPIMSSESDGTQEEH